SRHYILAPDLLLFIDTAPAEIYTLSLHDALPILGRKLARRHLVIVAGGQLEQRVGDRRRRVLLIAVRRECAPTPPPLRGCRGLRSEEHTSELQSLTNLVCRLLLEKKKNSLLSECV